MITKYKGVLLIVLQIIAVRIIYFFPVTIEKNYSNGIYIYISTFLRYVFGKIPFSIGDVLYILILLFIFYALYQIKKDKDNSRLIIYFVVFFYFLFHFLWGLNYNRLPLSEKMKIKSTYTNHDLLCFTQKMIKNLNNIHIKITKNDQLKVVNTYNKQQIFAKSIDGYKQLAQEYPYFNYQIPSQKASIFSIPLTYMGFAGYLNPFTNEAQVNDNLPNVLIPNVLCHEMAHQIGYASESECNFIGFLAGSQNPDLYFQYAAYSQVVKNCLIQIKKKQPSRYSYYKQQLHAGILINFKENELFWKKHESIIDQGFKRFYDQYLKMNQQKEGIASYSLFLNLLINYDKNHPIK
ncbi:hypothetical protein B0A58_10060 [Flavobacterium branchiophilum NBRC 15030 = ATCC 35035]|uniref:Uncharacterized protein DUF3810 n=1 Tax=Flavobacterium branchiophilum TaxID=55197 RepID=A0A543G5M3_9FLAO|nr:DUF3810 domain-containing protein [Flavobacterium branchiophilum]OXA74845.1 hypothetical protein B0A58_10060 [Flavobacterium branchiophilum NBRC 15030 = ATCC 35035]TQM41379.1 uncharacterized protein DUF3810 [Flavobacterium branchiophilum]GEM54993.1 hypothetical protein FB1_12140 [Flavobacterium branchiophilum NBRC 15030 = ATCC 35035]